MTSNIQTSLLKKIGPKTLALVWITPKKEIQSSPTYTTLHYLFNGIITPFPLDHMNVFEGESYGHKLFLLQTNLQNAATHLKQFQQIIETAYFEQAEMTILAENLVPEQIRTIIPSPLKNKYRLTILQTEAINN